MKSFEWIISCNTYKNLYEVGGIMDTPNVTMGNVGLERLSNLERRGRAWIPGLAVWL